MRSPIQNEYFRDSLTARCIITKTDMVFVFVNTWNLRQAQYQYFGWSVLKQYCYYPKTQIKVIQQNKELIWNLECWVQNEMSP